MIAYHPSASVPSPALLVSSLGGHPTAPDQDSNVIRDQIHENFIETADFEAGIVRLAPLGLATIRTRKAVEQDGR